MGPWALPHDTHTEQVDPGVSSEALHKHQNYTAFENPEIKSTWYITTGYINQAVMNQTRKTSCQPHNLVGQDYSNWG